MRFRIEKDDLGELHVPAEAYYGIQTLRSKQNFQIAKRPISRQLIKGLAIVKKAAAKANFDAGLLSKEVSDAIALSCDEILNGRLHGQFITDLVQGGAGTSMNMNANEVIANRANEMLGSEKGKYDKVHPIDHVNLCQSTNDVLPTAGKIATIRLTKKLISEMKKLLNAYHLKAEEYKDVLTMSKTHLTDNIPITFGQIFSSQASVIERDMKKIETALTGLLEINLGGTITGTGFNADEGYSKKIVKYISQYSGEPFVRAKNMVDNTRHLDAFAWLSSSLKIFALDVNNLATDLRLRSAVYKTIILPNVQPGSATNPGKINAVIPEMIKQLTYYVEGNDLTISRAIGDGEMEFNVNLPIILASLFENIVFIRRGIRTLRESAIDGLVVVENNYNYMDNSTIITAILPLIGYEKAQEVTHKAIAENKSFLEVIKELNIMTEAELKEMLTSSDITSLSLIGKYKDYK